MNINQTIVHHEFENGLVLIGETMPWLESAAFAISVPAGCCFDPVEKIGLANFTCEMVQRGCGSRSSRQFIEDLESLGVDYNSSASIYNTHFGGAMPADNLQRALSIYADVVRNPTLPEDQLEDGRMVCYQEVRSIEDDLSQKTMLALRQHHYGDPLGRTNCGTLESVESITSDDIRQFFEENYQPNGLIISVAGKIDWEEIKDHVGQLFGDWQPREQNQYRSQVGSRGCHHIQFDSQQTHIGLAYQSIPYSHEDYFLARGATGVLSGGMSSRLFHEVREKRGLCYSVFASQHSLRDQGAVICYCGTGADRAQESLDVIVEQLLQLADGISQQELDRLKVQIRSSLVMQQESSRSRASSIVGDWFHLGRVRPIEELNRLIKGLTVEGINRYLKDNPPGDFDMVTLGPQPLEIPDGVSSASAG